jgi:hypothetical protein
VRENFPHHFCIDEKKIDSEIPMTKLPKYRAHKLKQYILAASTDEIAIDESTLSDADE